VTEESNLSPFGKYLELVLKWIILNIFIRIISQKS